MLRSRVAQRLNVAEVRFACSLAAAALDGLFERAAGALALSPCVRSQRRIFTKTEFFRSLLAKRYRIGAAVTTDNGAFEIGRPACIGPGAC